ncbi:MAG: RuvA C-terminal domain-containing protein [Kofleriaceae bacterium]|nr:RuvA C-terminal domain-containing protein [Kofleriaceae bacterium]
MSRVVDTENALVTLGYKKHDAKAAVEQTRTHVGSADWPIDAWIRYALSKCSRG